ncbi:TPA: hypothetical protein DCX66_03430 [Candidatus Nomurabacteria bacterium]|uniref:Uncharacterized protein n=1 Tax=Candidatus Nomurabacteria bacterium GW2011_GWE1_35_16 TaxID=1618761 RepID=A0A0G0DVC5_9BACT|nr:MAG: hypothetical protein UR55_C0001G0064 [Candidatus Nomurabacteria bacterium GW2011_GWF1_34_20]KKP63773.1 MAG: hypothetical protein UR57_C0001G0064 [Candidatus Nomurabacteria bacterium GW2011_GWE2_34_25]KKP66985.1 MAG: hypothetical protein UR64_C0001G0064 [Candidatus Nomurabacteria bacterium GW2011_GWE1_35_16]HAE36807.1 hypothetical protein [Candidatus Nomurabacteria bacterium]HAX65490.1 hypothetical protein [Candidatus Nomurabacteria bacterium]
MDGILKRRGKNKESDPRFSIQTANGLMEVKRFFVVCSRPRKVVALGQVIDGEIEVDNAVRMVSLNGEETLECTVAKIEREKKKILYAVKNEQVGVCLKGITIHQLRQFNDSISVVLPAAEG